MKVTSSPSRWAASATAASTPPSASSAASASSPSIEQSGLTVMRLSDGTSARARARLRAQERREAVRAGESRQGNAQLLTDPHRFVHVLVGSGREQCFRGQQSPGEAAH